jgi:NitT/TauT family transport system permease protein
MSAAQQATATTGLLRGLPMRLRFGFRRVMPAVVSLTLIIGLWYLIIWIGNIPAFILPKPHDVVAVLVSSLLKPLDDRSAVPYHLVFSAQAAFIGFVLGSLGGLLLAILLDEIPILAQALEPWIMAFQAVPKLALAPLLLIYLGYDGVTPKVALVVIVVFFPMFVNTAAGLKGTDPDQANLMRLYGASRLQRLLLVRLPFAMPLIFAGLSISAVSSVVATTVSEFIGGRVGLGVLMLQRQVTGDIASVFALFIVLSGLAIIGYAAVTLAERHWLFWARRYETGEDEQRTAGASVAT